MSNCNGRPRSELYLISFAMSDAGNDSVSRPIGVEGQAPAVSEVGNVELPSQSQGNIPRDELLSKARLFLVSPSVQSQDVVAKRTFLQEKGLSEHEIDELLRTLVRTTFTLHL